MFENIFNEERFEEAVQALASIKMQDCEEEIKKKSAEFMQECMRLEEQMMPEINSRISEILKNA
jgi:ribosomal protein L1